jgi:GT2 family glycosyltransferase
MALPGGALVRKSIYDKVGGFEESFRAGQDHDMVLRIAEAAPFAYLPGTVFYYRKHADSISQNGLEKRWRIGFQILRRARGRYPYRRSTIRKRAAILNFRMAQVMFKQKRRIIALIYLLKSGVLDPARALNVIAGREKVG